MEASSAVSAVGKGSSSAELSVLWGLWILACHGILGKFPLQEVSYICSATSNAVPKQNKLLPNCEP